MIGVPLLKPCGVVVVTVTTLPGVAPSPDISVYILSGSDANAPTIAKSGRCGAKPSGSDGYFWSISHAAAMLNALENLLK